jgi:hypothetical protein
MRQVIARGTAQIDDPARLAPPQKPVAAVGVDETAYLRATATHATTFATGIADLSPGRPARLLDEEAGNLYWRAVRAHGVDVAAKQLADELDADRVGIFGEVFGAGVQDLHYGDSAKHGAPGHVVFDVKG